MFMKEHQPLLQAILQSYRKTAGLALLIKFMFIPFSNILLEWQTIIIFISIASMILGAVAAMIQKNFKRLLA